MKDLQVSRGGKKKKKEKKKKRKPPNPMKNCLKIPDSPERKGD